jgi:hypothetical protein
MITFQQEPLYAVSSEVDDLLRAHYLELAKNQDRVALNPDWDHYKALELVGGLLLYTVRKDEELIGYACFFRSPHPHYKDLMLVSNDVLYLDAAHRVGRTGVRFIRYCEEQIRCAQADNCCIAWHAKPGTALEGMLGRMGYQLQDVIYTKLS